MRRLALAMALAIGCAPIPVGSWTPREPTASALAARPNLHTNCEAILGVRPCLPAEVRDGRPIDSDPAEAPQWNRAAASSSAAATAPAGRAATQSPAARSGPAPLGTQFWGKVIESTLSSLLRPFSGAR